MTNIQNKALRPGEIRLDYISREWPLTPLGANKDPYVPSWQNKPFGVHEIEEEIIAGNCKAIGVMGGPAYNNPYGLIWVDIDGASVYQLLDELAGVPWKEVLTPTLTILSGKPGRERRLYKLDRKKFDHMIRNKYAWQASIDKEKLEILWKRHQGVLMGLHPETDGYYTAPGMGFEFAGNLPELPDFLLNAIINKNVKQGVPSKETTRVVGPGFVVKSEVGLERDIKLATEAMWGMPPEAADDYDIWITVGQTLHDLDDSLLEHWEDWSKQSPKYREGECHKRWLSFSKGGGRTVGTLIHIARENGWQPSQEHRGLSVDDETVERSLELLDAIETPDVPMATTFVDTTESQVERDTNLWGGRVAEETKPRKKLRQEKERGPSNPSSSKVTDMLRTMYNGNLRYSQPHGQFFIYGKESDGLWSPLTKCEMLGDIREKLVALGEDLPQGFSSNLMTDVFTQLQAILVFDDWYDGTDYLLFMNGVLDVEHKELLPFSKGMYFTQQMPYPYDPSAECEEIVKWLKHTQHDSWKRAQVLRAWLRATLLGRYEIQKFVEIVGPGKSGKSTYANLAVALVGKQNTYSTDFENLEKNRFEAASYMGKKLLLFQDADRWGGSVSKLKAITGNDWIRSERKYQSEGQDPFQYHGMVMITANEAIQSTDYTSGLARRRLTIPFDRPFEGGQAEQKELIKFDPKGRPQGVFAPLLPGLVNWLLDMSEEEMRSLLMETGKRIDFFGKYEKTQSLRSNPILDWMDHKIVFYPNARTVVGFCRTSQGGTGGYYDNKDRWLYASYAEFCRNSNVNIMSRGRFWPLFLDICSHQLKLNVFGKKDVTGMHIFNVAIRESNMEKFIKVPSIVEFAANPDKHKEEYPELFLPTSEKIEDDASM
jgi:phage/plasmid-associated DNA primase